MIDNQGNISLQFPRILVAALAFGVQRVGLHPTMAYLTLESPQLRSHSLLVPGSRFIAVSNPTFESKAPLTMLARLHILAHTTRRNSTSSTGAKAKKVVVPLIPPKRIYMYIYILLGGMSGCTAFFALAPVLLAELRRAV